MILCNECGLVSVGLEKVKVVGFEIRYCTVAQWTLAFERQISFILQTDIHQAACFWSCSSVFLERFLYSHPLSNVFLNTIIGFNKPRQHIDYLSNFAPRNDHNTICGIAEY